jgi:hypothetical protein
MKNESLNIKFDDQLRDFNNLFRFQANHIPYVILVYKFD